jgi:hypothetical protein
MELLVRVLEGAGFIAIGPSAGCGGSDVCAMHEVPARSRRQTVTRAQNEGMRRTPPENGFKVLDEPKAITQSAARVNRHLLLRRRAPYAGGGHFVTRISASPWAPPLVGAKILVRANRRDIPITK